MKKNIIFSGADATGKTTRAEKMVKQGYCLSILKDEINITRYSIKKNIEIALNQGLSNEKLVMDRSLIDLLAYYYINNRNGLVDKNTGIGNLHGIKKYLEEFILLNKGSILNYMIASEGMIIERLRERKEEELSKNDLDIINKEGYLEAFIATFDKIINILEKLNKKMGNKIEINIIDTTDLSKLSIEN